MTPRPCFAPCGCVSHRLLEAGAGQWATTAMILLMRVLCCPPQQDIHRGKGMVDSLFQGFQNAGTQNSILSSQEYLSTAARTMNNIEVNSGYHTCKYLPPVLMPCRIMLIGVAGSPCIWHDTPCKCTMHFLRAGACAELPQVRTPVEAQAVYVCVQATLTHAA